LAVYSFASLFIGSMGETVPLPSGLGAQEAVDPAKNLAC
jgi:hypothetical protein